VRWTAANRIGYRAARLLAESRFMDWSRFRGFPEILIDIVGGCNAKCPFCTTGREDFGKRITSISVRDFARTLERLMALGFAVPGVSSVGLYNWGEPVLHPDLNGIVAELNARKLAITIATNASRAMRFAVPTDGFAYVYFSVPGWSQASYDKIHGLKFDRVVANMEESIRNLRENGYTKPIYLSYHTYQFNYTDELSAARAWCAAHGVHLRPYYAYIADYEQAKSFLQGKMTAADFQHISRSLFLHYVDELVARQPKDWECPQWRGVLTLSSKSEVLLCGSLPVGHSAAVLGSVFELSREQILSDKVSSKECDECLGCGVAYWGHNVALIDRVGPRE
jgi:MoaA/NifB/PqqE/SkfB family radical SAM enzyme